MDMIFPRHNGVIENPLTYAEGVSLTVALGAAHQGDDYYNADVFGRVLHFGGSGHIKNEKERNPQEFTNRIDTQIDELKAIIAPYIGKLAAAKHGVLGVDGENGWELWQRSSSGNELMHTSGVILGVEGIAMNRTMVFNFEYPTDISKAYEASWRGGDYKIGVLLDTTHASRSFCFGIEAPEANRMLVPVRGFPGNKKYFSGLWSCQISGMK